MILYHGSTAEIIEPKILSTDRFLDFGVGFYTTTYKKQAVRWASRVAMRRKMHKQILSVYEFDFEKAKNELIIINFDNPNENWLEFVTACRSGRQISDNYDVVLGPVADDSVFETVRLFEEGILDINETIKRLKVEQIYNQVLLHTEKALDLLTFKESIDVGGNANG